MKKTAVFMLLFFLPLSLIFGKIKNIPFRPELFDINFKFDPSVTEIPAKEFENQHFDKGFKNKKYGYEVRYILFKQTAVSDSFREDAGVFSAMVLMNITGDENYAGETDEYKDDDVMKEFYGDFGSTTFITGCRTDFCEGYEHALVNFYGKEGAGIVCQVILFNDLKELQTDDFFRDFHSFNFFWE